MKKLSPAQVAALRLVATGTVSYQTGLRGRGRFAVRTETVPRASMHAISRRGLTEQQDTDRHWRKRVVLTTEGRKALDEAPPEEPKETP